MPEAQAPPKPAPAEQQPQEKGPQRQAVEQTARADTEKKQKDLDVATKQDAQDWFLGDNPDEEPATKVLKLDVTIDPAHPIEVEWTVRAMDRERIQAIREEARPKGRRARTMPMADEVSQAKSNLRVATEGTLYPDLRDEKVRGQFLDPADALKYRFRNKSGLIDQIAAEVMAISGYDDDDVQEVNAVKT